MKRLGRYIALTALSSVAMFSIHGSAIYHSNSIGQKLEVAKAPSTGWYLVEEGSQQTLYDGSSMLWTLDRQKDIVTTRYADGKQIEVRYKDNQIVSERQYQDGRLVSDSTYSYDDAKRLKEIVTTDGNLMMRIVRYYHSQDGSVAAIRTIDFAETTAWEYLGANWYSQQVGDMFMKLSIIANNIIVRESYVGEAPTEDIDIRINEAGDITVTSTSSDEQVQRTTYSSQGRITSEQLLEGDSALISKDYTYEQDGNLTATRIAYLDSGRIELSTYENGRLVLQEISSNDEIFKVIRYHEDGTKTETLYDDNVPYADVTYAHDGKRVLSVSYR